MERGTDYFSVRATRPFAPPTRRVTPAMLRVAAELDRAPASLSALAASCRRSASATRCLVGELRRAGYVIRLDGDTFSLLARPGEHRTCQRCGARLRRGNTDDFCAVCMTKLVAADYFDGAGGSLKAAVLNALVANAGQRVELQRALGLEGTEASQARVKRRVAALRREGHRISGHRRIGGYTYEPPCRAPEPIPCGESTDEAKSPQNSLPTGQ